MDGQQDKQQVNSSTGIKEENGNQDTFALHLSDSTLQTKDEYSHDKNNSHEGEDDTIVVAGIDDAESNSDRAAGTDMAGTAERKAYGDTELNKGLESQAKDAEG